LKVSILVNLLEMDGRKRKIFLVEKHKILTILIETNERLFKSKKITRYFFSMNNFYISQKNTYYLSSINLILILKKAQKSFKIFLKFFFFPRTCWHTIITQTTAHSLPRLPPPSAISRIPPFGLPF